MVRAPCRADRRAARARRRPARRHAADVAAHRLDHRRHQRRAARARPAPAATRSSRATRSTPACSARSRPRATRAESACASCPFEELPGEVRPDTRLVVTSHVSWATGRVMDTAPLAATRRARPARRRPGPRRGPGRRPRARLRLLRRLGPEVAVRPGRHRLPVREPGARAATCPRPGAATTRWSGPSEALVPALQPDARRLATGFPVPHHVEWTHASLDVLEEAGFDERVRRRDRRRGAVRGHAARPRYRGGAAAAPPRSSRSRCPTPRPSPSDAADQGIVIRFLPSRPWARASVGAWNTTRSWSGELAASAAAAA